MTIARRQVLQSAVAYVAVTVPAILPGCALTPATAAILKAAPYVPATDDDDELLRLSAHFHQICADQEALWERCCTMDASAPEAKALGEQISGMNDAWAGASDACYAMTPTTPAGAAALLSVILERDADFIDDEPKQALSNLHKALAAMVHA